VCCIEGMYTNVDEGNEDDERRGEEAPPAEESILRKGVRRLEEAVSPDRAVALLLSLVLFAFSLTFTLSRYLSASSRFPNYAGSWLIIVFEIIAIVVLVLMWVWPCAHVVHNDNDAHLPPDPWHRVLRHNIKLFGSVPFFLLIVAYDIIRLFAGFNCRDAWLACSSLVVRNEHIVDLVFPFIRTIYLFCEMFICVKYNEVNFRQRWTLLLGLAWIEATNLSGWVDALVDESVVFTYHRNWTDEISRCFRGTNASISTHVVQCYSRTTAEYRVLESASPYLYPFIMEYLLLVMECVADWFFSDAIVPVQPLAGADNAQQHQDVIQPQPAQEGADEVQLAEHDNAVLVVDAAGHERFCADVCRCPWIFISIILTFIVSIIFVIVGICNYLHDGYRIGFMYYRLVLWLLFSLPAFISCRLFRQHLRKSTNPNGFEYFVVLSCIGPILQCIFTIVANVQTKIFVAPAGLIMTEQIANIAQVVTQVILYRAAKRIHIHGNDQVELHCKRMLLLSILSCFVVFNFAMWFNDSFIETRSSANAWQNQYFYNWPVIYNICNPLTLMFRFNSGLLFLDVLLEKRY